MNWRQAAGWLRAHDRRMALAVIAATFLVLVVLSFNGDRAGREGFLAGIGWRYLQGVLLTMLVWGLFATGLGLQFGRTGLLNFGHVLFLGIGAYTAAVLTWRLGPGWHESGILIALSAAILILVISTGLSVLAALVLGLPTLRLREDYLAIVTIGAAEIMRLVWNNELWLTNGPKGLSVRMPGATLFTEGPWRAGIETIGKSGIELDPYFTFLILLVGAVLGATLLLVQRLVASPWGRVLTAIRENEDVAAALGKNVFAFKLQSLALGGAIAGIAGIFWAWSVRFVTPAAFLPLFTFYAWIMVVVGGSDRTWGPFVGSVILWGLFEAARQATFLQSLGLADTSGPEQVALIGLLLILIMRFRPQGLLGKREAMRIGR